MLSGTAADPKELEEELAVFGISASVEEVFSRGSQEAGPYEVHEDVADVFAVFQNCQGSWNVTAAGGLIGLVKTDVAAVAQAMGVPLDAEKLSLLIVCETEFIRQYNKKGPKRG